MKINILNTHSLYSVLYSKRIFKDICKNFFLSLCHIKSRLSMLILIGSCFIKDSMCLFVERNDDECLMRMRGCLNTYLAPF